jgi:putative tryptophan/tyrosine transport system substrate-binding protein
MKRRELIALLICSVVAWPRPAPAQPSTKLHRIGIIDDSPNWNAFREGLREHGYLEGQNLAFEYRYAGGLPDRLVWVAAELVRRPIDLIAATLPVEPPAKFELVINLRTANAIGLSIPASFQVRADEVIE